MIIFDSVMKKFKKIFKKDSIQPREIRVKESSIQDAELLALTAAVLYVFTALDEGTEQRDINHVRDIFDCLYPVQFYMSCDCFGIVDFHRITNIYEKKFENLEKENPHHEAVYFYKWYMESVEDYAKLVQENLK